MSWSQFYGRVRGRSKTAASRLGTEESGLTCEAACSLWCIETRWRRDESAKADVFEVWLMPWGDCRGTSRRLASGLVHENGFVDLEGPDPDDLEQSGH